MTPQEALNALACDPEDSIALGFLKQIIRRDWAVRVLDAWAFEHGTDVPNPKPYAFGSKSWCVWEYSPPSDTPDAARLAAAEAVWTELPESVRAEIGERP